MNFRNTEEVVRRSSSQMYFRIGVLKNFAMFTEKHLRWSFFLINMQVLRPARTPFFTEHSRWLLLEHLMNSLFIAFETMNSYVLALQRLFHFISCPSFLSISFFFSYFFLWILLHLGFEVCLSILKINQWNCS